MKKILRFVAVFLLITIVIIIVIISFFVFAPEKMKERILVSQANIAFEIFQHIGNGAHITRSLFDQSVQPRDYINSENGKYRIKWKYNEEYKLISSFIVDKGSKKEYPLFLNNSEIIEKTIHGIDKKMRIEIFRMQVYWVGDTVHASMSVYPDQELTFSSADKNTPWLFSGDDVDSKAPLFMFMENELVEKAREKAKKDISDPQEIYDFFKRHQKQ